MVFGNSAGTQQALALSFRAARLAQNHSQMTAAKLTGVPLATLKRFEHTGEISLRQFLMLVQTYGDLSGATALFPKPVPTTLDELLDTEPARQRGQK